MSKFISIQDASDLSKKSIQTIRRAIKAKKLVVKKKKTPQGFNYLVELDSLCAVYKIRKPSEEATKTTASENVKSEKPEMQSPKKETPKTVSKDEFKSFVNLMERLTNQHAEERQNFLRLMNSLQEKIFVLENQLNLLKEAPQKKWFKFWS